jgi:hypothetical protein
LVGNIVWGASKRDAALKVGGHTALLRCRPIAAAAAASNIAAASSNTAATTVDITAMCSHSALAPLVREALVHRALQVCQQPAAATAAANGCNSSSSSSSSSTAAAVTVGGAAALAQAGALWEQYDADAAADDAPYDDRESAAHAVVQSVLRAYAQLRQVSASNALG